MNYKKYPLIYGILISSLLILSFLVFSLFGLHTKPIFSLFNGVIMAGGMFLAIKDFKNRLGNDFNYENGFMDILLTGMNSTIIFTGFFAVYSLIINPEYVDQMFGYWDMSPASLAVLSIITVFIMGMATSVILALTYMQLFKKSYTQQLNNS